MKLMCDNTIIEYTYLRPFYLYLFNLDVTSTIKNRSYPVLILFQVSTEGIFSP